MPASARPRPNLFIIGAMKAGTSSLHSYLGTHPAVFMSDPKEPCYFVERSQLDWPKIERLGFWRGEDRYLALFAAAGEHPVVGESSTLYSKAPRISGVPERLAAFEPRARIVYVMRDPVERTLSHYWHAVRNRRERRDLVSALREEPHYREVSHYAMQLEPYLRLFGRDRVATLTLEELWRDPLSELRRLFAWLRVEPGFVPPNLQERRNVTPPEVERVRGRGRLERFRYSRLWETLGPLAPGPLRRWGRRLAAERIDRGSEEIDRAVDFLRPFQLRETEELQTLLGRDFPLWTTLHEGANS